jgi:hypothetical protein
MLDYLLVPSQDSPDHGAPESEASAGEKMSIVYDVICNQAI